MVSQFGLKHFSNTVDQNIDNRGIYNLSFCCILKLSIQLKKCCFLERWCILQLQNIDKS